MKASESLYADKFFAPRGGTAASSTWVIGSRTACCAVDTKGRKYALRNEKKGGKLRLASRDPQDSRPWRILWWTQGGLVVVFGCLGCHVFQKSRH
jgi:hypothetical protein